MTVHMLFIKAESRNAFKSKILPIKERKGEELKILTSKQMLQRVLIALAQVKAGSTSSNLLKLLKKKVYKNVMNSVKVQHKTE